LRSIIINQGPSWPWLFYFTRHGSKQRPLLSATVPRPRHFVQRETPGSLFSKNLQFVHSLLSPHLHLALVIESTPRVQENLGLAQNRPALHGEGVSVSCLRTTQMRASSIINNQRSRIDIQRDAPSGVAMRGSKWAIGLTCAIVQVQLVAAFCALCAPLGPPT